MAQTRAGGDAGLHLFDSEAGKHRLFRELVAGTLHPGVALLDQEPLLLGLLDLHERPFAVKLVALELEEQLALLEALAPILERHPFAAIPDDDAARAVVP